MRKEPAKKLSQRVVLLAEEGGRDGGEQKGVEGGKGGGSGGVGDGEEEGEGIREENGGEVETGQTEGGTSVLVLLG